MVINIVSNLFKFIALLVVGIFSLIFSENSVEGGKSSTIVKKEEKMKFKEKYILTPDYGRTKYLQIVNYNLNGHWGQFKLLLSEIRFLSEYYDLLSDVKIVYAGGADGRHITILLDMFPQVKEWHLYDPRSFYPGLDKNPKIKLNPFYSKINKETEGYGYFTDEVAQHYSKDKILFISDIRTNPSEEEILANQNMQMSWVLKMNPKAIMLKFKCPYPDSIFKGYEYEYLNGNIELQSFSPVTSAETRLVAESPYTINKYDIRKYEENMAYWNQYERTKVLNDQIWWDTWLPQGWRKGSDFKYAQDILDFYIHVSNSKKTKTEWMEYILQIIMNPGSEFQNYLKNSKLKKHASN